MIRFVLRRLLAAAALLFILLTITFFLLHLAPGEPELFLLDPEIPASQADRLRQLYGLDQPLAVQYLKWMGSLVLRGEWGISFTHNRPVTEVIRQTLPATLLLAIAALALQYGLGVPLGVHAARKQDRTADHAIRLGSLLLYSLPVFWLGLILILVFSSQLGLFPPGQRASVGWELMTPGERLLDTLRHLALPALTLGLAGAGAVARFTRNSLLEVFGEEYIRAARAKGMSERRVVWVHALRNGLVPIVQIFGLSLPFLLSGSLVVEVVFSWPGLGRAAYDAVRSQDYPLILATTALTALLVVVGNLLADLLQAAIDPRSRHV